MASMQMRAAPNIKPYAIASSDDTAEITMYGEVVESVPIDWWTGEPVSGLFIVLSDFLNDVENIKDKNSITVRINSVGGDLEAGIAIYNRLKELKGVTTIVDGLAASAASIISQAAAPGCRKIYTSSQIMIHGAAAGLCDYYNLQELDAVRDRLIAANNQVINVYAERTGETATKLRHMVEQTTWMTGQEAIDKGFADEIVSGENVTMSMSSDRSLFLCNGIPMNIKKLVSMPNNVSVVPVEKMQTAVADAIENNSIKEGGTKIMTVQELRAQHPELTKQIEDEAINTVKTTVVADATATERQRIQDIEAIENSIADKKLVNEAKYGEKPMTAKDLAFEAMKAQAQLGNNFLQDNSEDVKNSGAQGVQGMPEVTDKEKDELEIKGCVDAAKKMMGGK